MKTLVAAIDRFCSRRNPELAERRAVFTHYMNTNCDVGTGDGGGGEAAFLRRGV